MAPRIIDINNIKAGKVEWKIQVRILNLWEVSDYKNPLLTNTVELLLLDEHSSKIHVNIKKSLIQRFKDLLEEGGCHILENLLVAKNEMKYRTTKHRYKLSFMGSTKCTKIDTQQIPAHYYDFVMFPHIVHGADEHLLIEDVIVHVVEKDEIKELEKNGNTTKLLDFVLQDPENNRLFCTLWGNFAEELNHYLTAHDNNEAVVVILHMCRLNKFNGQMGVSNAYNGTKLLIDPDIEECSDYKNRLGSGTLSLKILICDNDGQVSNITTNVVYKVFQNLR